MSTPPPTIEGIWQMIRAEHAGDPAPDLVTEQMVLELKAGVYRVRYGGKEADTGTFEISAIVDSQTMVLRGTTGPNAGRTIPCIFQLRGDRLRVCYGFNGIAPTEFTTSAGDHRYLAVYRRV